MRIPYQDFPENIFSLSDEIGIVDQSLLKTCNMLSLSSYGYHGDKGTILASGSHFSTLLQLGDLLQEANRGYDMFLMSRINNSRNTELLSSIHRHKKLTVIMDHIPYEEWRNQLFSALDLKTEEIQFQWITPKYEKLTTIFDTYHREQTAFDAKSLFERLE